MLKRIMVVCLLFTLLFPNIYEGNKAEAKNDKQWNINAVF